MAVKEHKYHFTERLYTFSDDQLVSEFYYTKVLPRVKDMEALRPAGALCYTADETSARFGVLEGAVMTAEGPRHAYKHVNVLDCGEVCPYCEGKRWLSIPSDSVPCRYCEGTGEARNVEPDALKLWRNHLSKLDFLGQVRIIEAMEKNNGEVPLATYDRAIKPVY